MADEVTALQTMVSILYQALLCNVLFLAIFQVWWSLKNNPEYGRVAESCHRPKVELQLLWALDLANMVTT